MGIFIQEHHVNADRMCSVYTSDIYETRNETPGEVFRDALKEHGRCISKQYIDRADGVAHIGWVFQKRKKYEDSDDTYLSETWITTHERPGSYLKIA